MPLFHVPGGKHSSHRPEQGRQQQNAVSKLVHGPKATKKQPGQFQAPAWLGQQREPQRGHRQQGQAIAVERSHSATSRRTINSTQLRGLNGSAANTPNSTVRTTVTIGGQNNQLLVSNRPHRRSSGQGLLWGANHSRCRIGKK